MERGMRSKHVAVQVNLDRVRNAAEAIRKRTGVPIIAVVKADAYGLGAVAVAQALRDTVDEFAYFSLEEAQEVGEPGIVLGPPQAAPEDYAALRLRPTVFDLEQAARYRRLRPAVGVDTGMQRFGCAVERADEIAAAARASELLTHAASASGALRLREVGASLGLRMHAASTALLETPEAWLDAVRPGLALYRGALRVAARLYSVRAAHGPVGYSGFESPHVGIILAGYSNLVTRAPVLINGRRQRVLEAGMNSAFVSVDPADRAGDEVVLLGDGLTEAEVAVALNVREHEVLCRYASIGERRYVGAAFRRLERATAQRTPHPEAARQPVPAALRDA